MSKEKTIYNQTYDKDVTFKVSNRLLESLFQFFVAMGMEEVKEEVVEASMKVYAKTNENGEVPMYKTGLPVDYSDTPSMDSVEMNIGMDNPLDIISKKDEFTTGITPDGLEYLGASLEIQKVIDKDADESDVSSVLFLYFHHLISNIISREQILGINIGSDDIEDVINNIVEYQKELSSDYNLKTFYTHKGMLATGLYCDLSDVHLKNINKGITKFAENVKN